MTEEEKRRKAEASGKGPPPDSGELVRAYEAGETAVALAARYGRRAAAVRTLLKNAGMNLRRGRPPGSLPISARDQAIIAQYQAGETMTALGARYGVSRMRIQQILIRYGVERRRPGPQEGRPPSARNQAIIAQYQEGASCQEVGARYGISKVRVSRILIRYGVQRRRPRQRESD
jgi:transposase